VFFNDDNQKVDVVRKVSGALNQGKDNVVNDLQKSAATYCGLNGNRYEIYAKSSDLAVESDVAWIKQNLDLVRQDRCN
jgi:hypothetical protein